MGANCNWVAAIYTALAGPLVPAPRQPTPLWIRQLSDQRQGRTRPHSHLLRHLHHPHFGRWHPHLYGLIRIFWVIDLLFYFIFIEVTVDHCWFFHFNMWLRFSNVTLQHLRSVPYHTSNRRDISWWKNYRMSVRYHISYITSKYNYDIFMFKIKYQYVLINYITFDKFFYYDEMCYSFYACWYAYDYCDN